MAKGLPIKLKKEPLIDAVFEVRFTGKTPASIILPGILFKYLKGDKRIENLPGGEIPKFAREMNPGFKYAPVSIVSWGQFAINIGDFSVSVSCKYPYPGWGQFKPAIVEVMKVLNESDVADTVERYSMKYIDMIPVSGDKKTIPRINLKLSVANSNLENEPFQIRAEIKKENFINIVQIAFPAEVVLQTTPNKPKIEGLIVDVDTIADQHNISMKSFLDDLPNKLDSIHLVNKTMFFDCLTQETIQLLEPIYE